jgi:small redox-active disulfide protein 2
MNLKLIVMTKVIKVLGTGCAKCKTLENTVREVVAENNFPVEVVKVDDIMQIMNYGVLSTPGLVIDDKVTISGRTASKDEVKKIIEKHLNG